MSSFAVEGPRGVKGTLSLPGDKSIAHRCVILASLSSRKTVIRNFPLNEDCLSTLDAFKKLGVGARISGGTLTVSGRGLLGLRPPKGPLFVKESGTTYRLLLGVLAGQPFDSVLRAGPRLSRRPMLRVAGPLRAMGARLKGRVRGAEELPPFSVSGACLSPIRYTMPVASAQVKSAILFAGLYAQGTTEIIEKFRTRDHTERMLRLFGAPVRVKGNSVRLAGVEALVSPGKMRVPGDISSAAFFMVLAAITPGSEVRIQGVGLNPTRAGVVTVLKRMGCRLSIVNADRGPEPSGDIVVKSSRLKATVVGEGEIPLLIDELPVLMVAAALARGTTVFRGCEELRVKETDRIRSMLDNLAKMGVPCRCRRRGKREDLFITGVPALRGARVDSFGDHRTAMSMAVAGCAASGKTVVRGVESVDKSFPGFTAVLRRFLR